jgi:hypothetical protein
MNPRVKLYLAIMTDEDTLSHIAVVEAEERPKTYAFAMRELSKHDDGYEIQRALGYTSVMLKTQREDRLFGLDPIDAAHLAMTHWQAEVERLKKKLREAERNVTECAFMGLDAVAKEGD